MAGKLGAAAFFLTEHGRGSAYTVDSFQAQSVFQIEFCSESDFRNVAISISDFAID